MVFPHLNTVTPFEDNVTDVLAEDQVHHAIFGNLQVTTLPTAIKGSATAGSTGQTLVASGATFVSSGVVVGDVVYNATDASYAIVKTVSSETQIITTPLKGGAVNLWSNADSFSVKTCPNMLILLLTTDGANLPGIYVRNSGNTTWNAKGTSTGSNTGDQTITPGTVTATASQTVFTTPTYVIGNNKLEVYINGILQYITTDYTETSTSSITFTSGLTAGDIVKFRVLS